LRRNPPVGLLRAFGEWQYNRSAANWCDEFPSPHGFACAKD